MKSMVPIVANRPLLPWCESDSSSAQQEPANYLCPNTGPAQLSEVSMDTLAKNQLTTWLSVAGLAALLLAAVVSSKLTGAMLFVPAVVLSTVCLGARNVVSQPADATLLDNETA